MIYPGTLVSKGAIQLHSYISGIIYRTLLYQRIHISTYTCVSADSSIRVRSYISGFIYDAAQMHDVFLSAVGDFGSLQKFTMFSSVSLTHTVSFSLTHTVSLSHTHTRSLSLTHTVSICLSHTLSLSLSLSHTHTLSLTHTVSLSLTHTLSHTRTHTHTHCLSHSLTQCLTTPPSPSPSPLLYLSWLRQKMVWSLFSALVGQRLMHVAAAARDILVVYQ